MDRAMITVAGVMPVRIYSIPMKTMPGTVFKMDSRGIRYLARAGRRDSPMPSVSPSTAPMATLTSV